MKALIKQLAIVIPIAAAVATAGWKIGSVDSDHLKRELKRSQDLITKCEGRVERTRGEFAELERKYDYQLDKNNKLQQPDEPYRKLSMNYQLGPDFGSAVATVVNFGDEWICPETGPDNRKVRVTVDGHGNYTPYTKSIHTSNTWEPGNKLRYHGAEASHSFCHIRVSPTEDDPYAVWERQAKQ